MKKKESESENQTQKEKDEKITTNHKRKCYVSFGYFSPSVSLFFISCVFRFFS